MYKLFLTIRYLTRKAIVIFPILVVWLCVAMLIIVTSIMGGFAEKVKQTNRDFTGDIVVTSGSRAGFPYYQEMQAEIAKIPTVELSTPMVQAFGLLNTTQGNVNVQVYGVIPEERARVTKWRDSLFFQHQAPEEAVEDLSRGGFPATSEELTKRAEKIQKDLETQRQKLAERAAAIREGQPVTGRGFNVAWIFLLIPVALLEWLLVALTRDAPRWWRWVWWAFPASMTVTLLISAIAPMVPHTPGKTDEIFQSDALEQWHVASTRGIRTYVYARTRLPEKATFKSAEELRAVLIQPPTFSGPSFYASLMPSVTTSATTTAPKADGVIVGVDMAYKRNLRGNYERPAEGINLEGLLVVAPMVPSKVYGSTPLSGLNAQTARVRILDDSYTGFFEADKSIVYADFDMVQHLALMHAQEDATTGAIRPARASAIEVKIKGDATPERLAVLRDQVSDAVDRVQLRHAGDFDMTLGLKTQTWDEKQADYIAAVVNEKNMITFILLLMSVVVLVVEFLIFYIIVRDKTRDIGIIKAVGGSEWGVANIFTIYGAVIGILGGAAGAVTGIAFVRHTNEIHEWIYQTFGIMIWRRDVYMFDRIPDQFNWWEVALYFGIAVGAGILGALIPALVAGFQNPVRALRHE